MITLDELTRNAWQARVDIEKQRAEDAEAILSQTQAERDEYRAECERLREQVATLRYALNTVINAERGITQYHVDLALSALQETA